VINNITESWTAASIIIQHQKIHT